MRSLFIALIFVAFALVGFTAPFVLALCYVWVDIVKPQTLGFGLLDAVPLSFIAGLLTLLAYLLLDRGLPSRVTFLHVLLAVWAAWVTLTTFWAIVPAAAWSQWNTAIKTILFAAFLPLVVRTRTQIDALLIFLALVPAIAVLPTAVKTLITGGGYGTPILLGTGTLTGESATFSLMVAMTIPLSVYAAKSSLLPFSHLVRKLAVYAYIPLCLVAIIGTEARTGLMAVSALGVSALALSENKIRFSLLAAVLAVLLIPFLAASWISRMHTILDPSAEQSASGRLEVWAWTMNFVKTHPLGGGFEVYRINNLAGDEMGRAFHSIYFQTLGEHGYIGIIIYVAILLLTLRTQLRLYKRSKRDELLSDSTQLYKSMFLCTVAFLVGGATVGIAYLPIFYFLVAVTISLDCEKKELSTPISKLHSMRPAHQLTTRGTQREPV